MKVGIIWAEMARRKVQFHKNEKWNEISLWGLFAWQNVSRLIENGQLHTNMKKENHTIWVTPSREAWEKKIKPLINKYSLDELADMAGW
jgi:hypothetical protein